VTPNESVIRVIKDMILQDIYDNHRSFLSGPSCTSDEVERHMGGTIKMDNITDEERLLLLSTLPRHAEQLWIAQLDKGLSGSTVFSVRYSDAAGRLSKSFVAKIGEREKIAGEVEATSRYAAPYLPGIETPVCRQGQDLGLIGQELRGLSSHARPQSLRNYLLGNQLGPDMVARLLEERLDPWYSRYADHASRPVRDLLRDYLAKGPADVLDVLPDGWEELTNWTRQIGGFQWQDVGSVVERVVSGTISSPVCIIHGDLHTQNVLVDPMSQECWPIDFAWTRESSPLIDLAMLECSLKFLAIPERSDLRTLLEIEMRLASEPAPVLGALNTPYFTEVSRIVRAVGLLRTYALEKFGVTFSEFRKLLLAMTYSLSANERLNRPYVIGSLQLLAGAAA
jgi:Ternary complex associated domain 9